MGKSYIFISSLHHHSTYIICWSSAAVALLSCRCCLGFFWSIPPWVRYFFMPHLPATTVVAYGIRVVRVSSACFAVCSGWPSYICCVLFFAICTTAACPAKLTTMIVVEWPVHHLLNIHIPPSSLRTPMTFAEVSTMTALCVCDFCQWFACCAAQSWLIFMHVLSCTTYYHRLRGSALSGAVYLISYSISFTDSANSNQ